MNPREFVKEYSIKSLVCCFSGGKDSLVATHYVLSELGMLESLDKYVICVDTGAMLPITIPFVHKICQEFGWNLIVLEGHFFEKAEKWGMPRMKRRWCCWECKMKPIHEFVRHLEPQRGEVTGLRRDESKKRTKTVREVYRDKRTSSWKYAPIWDWTEKDVLRYMKEHDLPMPPHYKLGIAETCQCGVFASKKRMMIIKALYPDFFQKFVELEARFKSGGAAFYFQNKPTYAKDFLKQKTLLESGSKT